VTAHRRHLGIRRRLLLLGPLVAVLFMLSVGTASATETSVGGNVSNGGGAIIYSTQRCLSYNNGPYMTVTSYPGGSTLYLAANFKDNGSWFTTSYTTYSNYWGNKRFANLVQGTCFHVAAHRDWAPDFWDTSTWTGNLGW
jgi:hypothetical protein